MFALTSVLSGLATVLQSERLLVRFPDPFFSPSLSSPPPCLSKNKQALTGVA